MSVTSITPINSCDKFSERLGENYETTQNKSLQAVVNNILGPGEKNDTNQVLYFGELHKLNLQDYKIELMRFTEEALPALKEHGITDIIMEFIPDDPLVEEELKLFYKTGDLSPKTAPFLFSLVNQYIFCSLIKFLEYCQKNGINVHGGGPSLVEAKKTTLQPDYQNRIELLKEGVNYVKEHTQEKVKQLIKSGNKFAIYGGMAHNDLNCSLLPKANLGTFLKKELGNKYIEIDIIIPETLETFGPKIKNYFVPKGWKKFIPKKGVKTLKKGNSYVVFFPRTKDVKTLNNADEFLKCPLASPQGN